VGERGYPNRVTVRRERFFPVVRRDGLDMAVQLSANRFQAAQQKGALFWRDFVGGNLGDNTG
jgi:hypothetical protein